MNEQNLAESLRHSADRIETSPAPITSMIVKERRRKVLHRTWGVALAASICVAFSIGMTNGLLGSEQRSREIGPTNEVTSADLTIAKRYEQQMKANIKGTYVGGLVSALPSNGGLLACQSGHLLVVRGVWQEDANFLHSGLAVLEGYPAPPPDGPMKATFVVVERDTGKECLRGATFRSVGAAPEETLLSGVRPSDPTGAFDPASVTAGHADLPTLDSPLEGTWQVSALVGINGKSLLADRYATGAKQMRVTFTNGQVTGNTGCNSISGQYKHNGRNLRFDGISTTLKGCTDEPPLLPRLHDVRHLSGTGDTRYLHAENWMVIAKLERVLTIIR